MRLSSFWLRCVVCCTPQIAWQLQVVERLKAGNVRDLGDLGHVRLAFAFTLAFGFTFCISFGFKIQGLTCIYLRPLASHESRTTTLGAATKCSLPRNVSNRSRNSYDTPPTPPGRQRVVTPDLVPGSSILSARWRSVCML